MGAQNKGFPRPNVPGAAQPAQTRPDASRPAPPHAHNPHKPPQLLQRKTSAAPPNTKPPTQKLKPPVSPSAPRQLIKPSHARAQGVAPQPSGNPIQRKADGAPKPNAAAQPPQAGAGGVVQLVPRLRNKKTAKQGLNQTNIIKPRTDYLGNALGINKRGIPIRKKWRAVDFSPGMPLNYRDVPLASPHANLRGIVWVRTGPIRLWWQRPRRQINGFHYQGSRVADIAYCNANYEAAAGYTWHHCADYAGGVGTMQLVPTVEHGSWGHWGGVEQARAAGVAGY